MPSLTITAPQEQFNAAVEAICFVGKRSESSEVSKSDFAIERLKKWLGEQMTIHQSTLISQAANSAQIDAADQIAALGAIVEVTIAE